jgi:hypothetical protein
MRLNRRLSQFLAGALGFFAGWLLDAYLGDYLLYPLLTLLMFGPIVYALEPFARKRGWGIEGRLTRHLNRPGLIEEGKRFYVGSRHGL